MSSDEDTIKAWKNSIYTLAQGRFMQLARMANYAAHNPQASTPPARQPQPPQEGQQQAQQAQRPQQPQQVEGGTGESEGPTVFRYLNRGKDQDDPRASEETLELFAELIRGFAGLTTEEDDQKVRSILQLTFNEADARKISNDGLQDMIDYYVSYGEENLRAVADLAYNRLHREQG